MFLKYLIFIITLIGLSWLNLFGQGRHYEGPDDPAGDIAAEREGWMTGNRVLLYFQNTTELGNWPNYDQSKWPNDYSGTGMHDGVGLFLGAKVYIKNDSIPVDDPAQIASEIDNLETIWFCETSYRHGMDRNLAGTVEWGLYPVFGYFNENSEYPAMSNRPESWPQFGWPARGDDLKWPNEWDGRFGRGIMYADLESYFVANDAQDQEYLQPVRREQGLPVYYPRPGVYIGDKKSDVTIQEGMPWGGLGLRVKVRGYQWNNMQTRDAIFWEYDIANISDYDINDAAFGYWLDNGIGHRGNVGESDDIGSFDKVQNLAYSWDVDGIGVGGLRTGINGFAFLESPGKQEDNLDNDDDGLTDESRDNHAEFKVGPLDGITDLEKFMDWYGYTDISQLREHWDADEDQDWEDGEDTNNNGVYDLGENPGDDVGTDGVGPGELNYIGPDEDGSECNHKPDFMEGIGSEPDFGPTDISESDMIGLTAFTLFHHPQTHEPPMSQFDKEAYEKIAVQELTEFFGELSNLIEMFGSGTFQLLQGRTERVSLAELHSYEELAGLNSGSHLAPSLFEKKRIVQFIYESDYRFAQPPKMPTLKAAAGDGKVYLSWDDVADKLTREPLLKGENDFEGYKLYKATDKYFADAEMLMDMYGNPIGKKPIFQCDKVDGKQGAADFAHINGEIFYLGNESGIKHYFVDEDVQNGRTYYYGLAAYDYGMEGLEVAIMPSENNVVIDLDENENIRFTGKNVQVVTPHQQAAGYVSPSLEISKEELHGNGTVSPVIYDINAVKADHTYKIKFHVDTLGYVRSQALLRHHHDMVIVNNGMKVYDVTGADVLVYEETALDYPVDNMMHDGMVRLKNGFLKLNDISYYNNVKTLETDIFDGIQLKLDLPSFAGFLSDEKSGWVRGNAPITVQASLHESKGFPYTYDIIFSDNPTAHTPKITRPSYILNLIGTTGEGSGASFVETDYILGQSFPFYAVNRTLEDSSGNFEQLEIIVEDMNHNGRVEILEDRFLAGHYITLGSHTYWGGTIFGFDFRNADSTSLPQAGDVYRVDFDRPFAASDSIMVTVTPPSVDDKKINSEMSDIKVVPNPYVATNTMEAALSNPNLNQRRRIMFTHVPAESEIKIFTVSGAFVDEIEVFNPPERGIVHWDLLTKEGLEIAAGIYLYHVKSLRTGEEKMGKFAVIK